MKSTKNAGAPDPPPAPPPIPKMLAGNRFNIERELGRGCFGEVWLGKDGKRSTYVAVKFELKGDQKQLANEYEILSELKRPEQQQGFTEVFHFGRDGPYVCLVMELLGKSLEDWLEACNGKFNVQTTALIGLQILQRIEYLHSKCIIHRDIKPENFMMGSGVRSHIVYLIDFGLSEVYWDLAEAGHVSSMPDTLTGTARYASIHAHDWAQSRRDDLESIGHMLIFFVRGSLPWSGLPRVEGKDEFEAIRNKKMATPVQELCSGLPPEFADYLSYCRNLAYKQRPDYERLRSLFRNVTSSFGDTKDTDLQWLRSIKDLKIEELEKLSASPIVDQPDDNVPATSLCGCCKRRDDSSRNPLKPERAAAPAGATKTITAKE